MSHKNRERRLKFEKHRKNVLEAKANVDDKPPIVHTSNYSRFPKVKQDTDTSEARKTANNQLMYSINSINRTVGYLDSFPKKGSLNIVHTKLPMMTKYLRRVELANFSYGQRLLCTKAALRTRRRPRSQKPEDPAARKEGFEVPTAVLQKYQPLELPQNIDILRQLLRPRIFFELAVMNFPPLGRIIVQLFTEACPEVVLEFVRVCRAQAVDKIRFMRLFPQLWLEGEIALAEGKVFCMQKTEYDMRALDHGSGPGILSIAARNAKCFRKAFLNFSISFKPLCVLNGQRVAFGKVQRGLKILDCLQDYGSKNGKPIRKIEVVNCGVLV